jgi:hypothetical protein
MRAVAALQGAVLGAGVFFGGWALILGAGRWIGAAGARTWMSAPVLGAAAGCVAAGMVLLAVRGISFSRCARALDRALGAGGGEPRNGDRMLAALGLVDHPLRPLPPGQGTTSAAFIEAAIADALRSSGRMAPEAAAPWRRPRGLGVAATLAAGALVLALWPQRPAPASTTAGPAVASAAARLRIDQALLAADRDAVEEAARQAAALGDEALARLAAELGRILAALAEGGLDQSEALERLAGLAREAARAGAEGRALAQGLQAAAAALARDRTAGSAGLALASNDDRAARSALEALAARSAQMTARQRDALAQALARAAAAAADPAAGSRAAGAAGQEPGGQAGGGDRAGSPASGPGGSNPAGLASSGGADSAGKAGAGEDGSGTAGQAGAGNDERQLRRLERELSSAAQGCQGTPEECARALREAGANLPPLARAAQRSNARRGLGRTAEQLRERLRRLDSGDRAGRLAEQSFERAAGGARPSGASGATEGEDGEGAQQSPSSAVVAGPTSEGTSAATGESSRSEPGAAPTSAGAMVAGADGVGRDPGADPLGPRQGATAGSRGEARQARIKSGAGPSRAEVIEDGAHRGFARTEYQRVFEDYSAAVEESLDTTAVPPARRYLVRRYFQLIRPRVTAPGDLPR